MERVENLARIVDRVVSIDDGTAHCNSVDTGLHDGFNVVKRL